MGRNSPHYKREAWYHLPHSKPKDLERRFKGREPPCRRADRRQQATVSSQEKRHGQSRSFFTPHTLPKTAALPLPQPFHRHPCRHTPAHRKRAGACSGRPPFFDMSGLHSISIEQVHVQAETQQNVEILDRLNPLLPVGQRPTFCAESGLFVQSRCWDGSPGTADAVSRGLLSLAPSFKCRRPRFNGPEVKVIRGNAKARRNDRSRDPVPSTDQRRVVIDGSSRGIRYPTPDSLTAS